MVIVNTDWGIKFCSNNNAAIKTNAELTDPDKNIIVVELNFFLSWLMVTM